MINNIIIKDKKIINVNRVYLEQKISIHMLLL